ncbi:MAG: hypothetical protein GX220_05800 [Treponema sp.]|nr:hypothetical protein [Treponema sp.]
MIQSAVLIPKEIYCGDEANYIITLKTNFEFSNDEIIDINMEESFKTIENDVTILSAQFYKEGGNDILNLKIIPWKTGAIQFNPIQITENFSINVPEIFVNSILEKTNEETLQPLQSPILVPGTTYFIYSIIFITVLFFVFVTGFLLKFSQVKNFFKKVFFKNLHSRNCRKTLKKLKLLKKSCFDLEEKTFAKKLYEILCAFFSENFSNDFFVLTSSEIKNYLYNFVTLKQFVFSEKEIQRDNFNEENLKLEAKSKCENQSLELYEILEMLDKIKFSSEQIALSVEEKNQLIESVEKNVLFYEECENVTL